MQDIRVALIRTVLSGKVEAALILADYLEERGECYLSLLLRRRYKKMMKVIDVCRLEKKVVAGSTLAGVAEEYQRKIFLRYIARKFIKEASGRLTPKGGSELAPHLPDDPAEGE